MGVFGSREDDPLLNHDPFAPLPQDEADASGEGEDRESESSAARDEEHSVFRSGKSGSERASPNESTRVVTRSLDAAADGDLPDLNAAFEEGWRLSAVELQIGVETDGSGGVGLAFVLQERE